MPIVTYTCLKCISGDAGARAQVPTLRRLAHFLAPRPRHLMHAYRDEGMYIVISHAVFALMQSSVMCDAVLEVMSIVIHSLLLSSPDSSDDMRTLPYQ